MPLTSLKLVKDTKSGEFYLVGPGHLKEKVSGNLQESWERLSRSYEENLAFFREAGLEDEIDQLEPKRPFGKGLWLDSLLRGTIMMIPMLVGFFLFSFALTEQFSKLTFKINEVIKPYSERAAREELGFKKTLERYRPYIYETLKVFKEEGQRVEAETEPRKK